VHAHHASHSPHTLRLARKPKYTRKALVSTPTLDAYTIVKHPLTTGALQ
jgi:hypothetical protein